MEFEALRVGIAFAGCLAATYFDLFNNRNIPNLLTYAFVAIGVLFGIYDLYLAPSSFLFIIGPAIMLFAFGYYFYINGQIGGADVLAFLAIALLIPSTPTPLLGGAGPDSIIEFPFVVSIFVISGVLFAAYMLLALGPKILKAVLERKAKVERQNLLLSVFLLAAYGFLLWNLMRFTHPAIIAIAAVVLVSAILVYLFRDFILDEFVIQYVPLGKIDEEDVLAVEKMDQELVKKYQLKKLLTDSELKRLKDVPIKEYPIYKNLPCFMPYILLALIISVVFGDVFTLFLRL